MYYHGIMPRKSQSYEESLNYHEKAKNVSGFSAREAAYLKSRGCGCDFDFASIVEYYSEAIKSGDTMAVVGLAKFYMKYGKYKEAAELYKKAKNILPNAEFQLGMLYRDGMLEDPPRPDFYKAAYYFQHAISSGYCDSEVYHQLGRLYLTPIGDFEKDFNLAEENFKISADMGNRHAQYKLGLMYEYGYTEKNIEKAIHYHKLAALQGDAKSAYHLALLYQSPEYRNYQEAYKHAEFAAKKGIMEGEFLLGIFLFYGRGCNADENKAYEYFERAYDHGMCIAKIYLDKYDM
jgi:TPR repeat protein